MVHLTTVRNAEKILCQNQDPMLINRGSTVGFFSAHSHYLLLPRIMDRKNLGEYMDVLAISG